MVSCPNSNSCPDSTAPPSRQDALPLTIECLTDWSQVERVRDAWDALVVRSVAHTVYQTYAWCRCWFDAFARDAEPLIVGVWRGDALVGLAPLMRSHQAVSGGRAAVAFIGGADADHKDLLYASGDEAALQAMVEWLYADNGQWGTLRLIDIADDSATLVALQETAARRNVYLDVRRLYDAPTLFFADLTSKQWNKKGRKARWRWRRLADQGDLCLVESVPSEDAERYLNRFFELHIAHWGATPTPSMYLEAPHRRYLEALVRGDHGFDALRFSALLLDGEPISLHLGFEYASTFLYYKPTYDMLYSESYPGLVLMSSLMESARDRGLAEFDFGYGEEAYKYPRATHIRVNYAVRVYRRAVRYQMARRTLDAKEALKRAIKKSPKLTEWVIRATWWCRVLW